MDRYCIIGAGPAGLAQARAFRWAGVPFDVFERHVDVGGLWDLENPGTPMYSSCRLISSRQLSGFFGFPMPRDYPDYPTHVQVHAYLREFARAHRLYDQIEFGREVVRVELDGGEWVVGLVNGETRRYAGVVCANGMNWIPNWPEYFGIFTGQIRHAVDYRDKNQLGGRRVLVVGGATPALISRVTQPKLPRLHISASDAAIILFLSTYSAFRPTSLLNTHLQSRWGSSRPFFRGYCVS
jgi:cation diffusion facilitator CzcD-associated flavoprotein CzcO